MFDSKVENGVKVEIKFNDDYDGDDGFFKCSVGNFGFYESPIEVLPKFLRDVVSPILGIEIGKPDDKDM